jgi:hypothetical protein
VLAARCNLQARPLSATRVDRPDDEPYIFRLVRRITPAESLESAERLSPYMTIPEIGQRIAFVTDNVGTIIELAEPGTRPSARNGRA